MSVVCKEYAKRVGNEVGWADFNLEYKLDEMLKCTKPEFEKMVNKLNKETKQANYKRSIIYLLSLFEAFMYDFISEKEKLSDKDTNIRGFWKKYLEKYKIDWESYYKNSNIPMCNSASLMNIRYSLFILDKRYKILYPVSLTNLVLELGSLRNCIVHHNGKVSIKDRGNEYSFRETLEETIKFLNMDSKKDNIGEFITYEYIKKITFDLQKFIEHCIKRSYNIKKANKK